MTRSPHEFRISYKTGGYGAPRSFPDDFQMPRERDPWLVCALAFDRARKGDFSMIEDVANLWGATGSQDIDNICTVILAATATSSAAAKIREKVEAETDLRPVFHLCGVLGARGELGCLPILLKKYLENEKRREREVLLTLISDLTGDPRLAFETEDFEEDVEAHYQTLLDRFQSEQTLIYAGGLYSVTQMARDMLDEIQTPYFRFDRRLNFEAATGMNCDAWYEGDQFKPLAAAATLETFLESPRSQNYKDGVRYFFGFPIP